VCPFPGLRKAALALTLVFCSVAAGRQTVEIGQAVTVLTPVPISVPPARDENFCIHVALRLERRMNDNETLHPTPSRESRAQDSASALLSVVYVSSAIKKFSEKELVDLLRIARCNNERLEVTGMLLYHDGNFMQVLEGPEQSVQQLIGVISSDHRHHGMIRLLTRHISARSFADWSMAFQNLDLIPSDQLQAFSPFLTGSLLDERFRERPDNCYRLMLSFKRHMLHCSGG
jgi:hypothetical protein